MIDKYEEIHGYLAEMLEYDVQTLFSQKFALKPVVKTDAALLFNNDVIENEQLSFYQQIPEIAPLIARYTIIKCFILRKICKAMIEEYSG